MKHERFVRLCFFCFFLLSFLFYYFPIGDTNLEPFYVQLQLSLRTRVLPSRIEDLALTHGNYLFLYSMLAMTLIKLFLSFIFSQGFVAEVEGETPLSGVLASLRSIPSLILFGLVSFVVAWFSTFLLFIPFFFFISVYYFAPYFMVRRRLSFFKAMRAARLSSKGVRLSCYLIITLYFLFFSYVTSFFDVLAAGSRLSFALISALTSTLVMLTMGRLYALVCLYFNQYVSDRSRFVAFRNPRRMFEHIEAGKPPKLDDDDINEIHAFEDEIRDRFPQLYQQMQDDRKRFDSSEEDAEPRNQSSQESSPDSAEATEVNEEERDGHDE
ncbi:MAG: hypothetical protein Q4P72_06490 [Eubacteriales bacterium]|nr:hypothetical protein [Eubacteriales bacterium]